MNIIKKPVITEKTLALVEASNIYVFEVATNANKHSARQELQKLFNVVVDKVTTLVRPGKEIRWSKNRRPGRRSSRKIMYFKLAAGNSIDIFKQ